MFDENEHTHPQNNDEGPRHIHRGKIGRAHV